MSAANKKDHSIGYRTRKWGLRFSILFILLLSIGMISYIEIVRELNGMERREDPYHDLLISPRLWMEDLPESISRNAAVEDVAVFQRILQSDYGRYDYYQELGTNWVSVFDEIRNKVKADSEPIETEAFRGHLLDCLGFVTDFHFSIDGIHASSKKHAFAADLFLENTGTKFVVQTDGSGGVPPGSVLISCEGSDLSDLLRPTITNFENDEPEVGWLMIELSAEHPKPLSCVFESEQGEPMSVALPMHRLKAFENPTPCSTPFLLSDETIPIVKTCFFGPEHNLFSPSEDHAFTGSSATLRDAPNFVVDLRGNIGGFTNSVFSWFDGLTTHPLEYPVFHCLHSEATLQAELSEKSRRFYRCCLNSDRRCWDVFPEVLSSLFKFHWIRFKRRETPFSYWDVDNSFRERNPFPADRLFANGFVLLVDSRCKSACEWFVFIAKQIPNTVVVGENTLGAFASGWPYFYTLPNSRIIIKAPSAINIDPNSHSLEGIGFAPDVWLDDHDPLIVAKSIADCLVNVECRDSFQAAIQLEYPH